jgi:hypothetical protein
VSLTRLSSSATAYLYGRMTSTRRMGRRPFPTCIAIPPSPSPHPAVPAPPISPPHHCATFPFRSGCAASTHILDLPLLRLPAPYLHTRSWPHTVSAAWAPAIACTVMAFRIQNLNGAQMDREVWAAMCACRLSPAAVGEGGRNKGWGEERWRRRRDAPVQAHARRKAVGFRGVPDVGDPRASRLGVADAECTYVWRRSRALASATYHPSIPSHRIFPSIYTLPIPPRCAYFTSTYLHPVHPSKNVPPLRMRASPPVFLFSLAFLCESTCSSCFHAYFFDVPLFLRPLQIRTKNANDVDPCIELILYF